MEGMVTQQNFLKRWFPTFVSLFEQFKGDQTESKASSSLDVPRKFRPRPDAPFFLQGIEDSDLSELCSREKLLESLEWVKPPLANRGFSTATPSINQAIAEAEIIPEAVAIQSISAVPIPLRSVPDLEPDLDETNFFIRGLRTMGQLENFKNMDLLAALAWEEQGQTLQEVDPDDYELLDDLLDMADP